jgi:hypothetical protein
MHVFVTEKARVMRDYGQPERRGNALVAIRDKQVNGSVSNGGLIVESVESVQPCGGQSRQGGSRSRPQLRNPEQLTVGERPRLRDGDTADRLLPASGGHSAPELLLRQVAQGNGGAQNPVVFVDDIRQDFIR